MPVGVVDRGREPGVGVGADVGDGDEHRAVPVGGGVEVKGVALAVVAGVLHLLGRLVFAAALQAVIGGGGPPVVNQPEVVLVLPAGGEKGVLVGVGGVGVDRPVLGVFGVDLHPVGEGVQVVGVAAEGDQAGGFLRRPFRHSGGGGAAQPLVAEVDDAVDGIGEFAGLVEVVAPVPGVVVGVLQQGKARQRQADDRGEEQQKGDQGQGAAPRVRVFRSCIQVPTPPLNTWVFSGRTQFSRGCGGCAPPPCFRR